VGLTIVVVAAGVVLWLPLGRRRLIPQLRQGAAAIVTVLGRPAKAAQLFGGSAAVTALYVLALSASLEAFRSPVPVVEVTAVYLGSAAIAAAAPTPGICPVGELRSEMHRFGASRSRERPSRPDPPWTSRSTQ
jgi:glycosyltransferase 2 family protein